MAFTFKAPIVAVAGSATSAITATLTTGYASGSVVIAWVGCGASGASGTNTTDLVVTDSKGNSWVRAKEFIGSGGAVLGARAAAFFSEITVPLVSGDTVSLSGPAGTPWKQLAVGGFKTTLGGASLVASTGLIGATGTAAISGSIAGLAAATEYLYIATIVGKNSTTVQPGIVGDATWTLSGAAAGKTGLGAGIAAFTGSQTMHWNYKILTASGINNLTTGLFTTIGRAGVLIALKEKSSVVTFQGTAVLAAAASFFSNPSTTFVGRATLPLSASVAVNILKNPLEATLPLSASVVANLRQVWVTNPAVLAAAASVSVNAIKNPLEATLPLSSSIVSNLRQVWVTNPATLPLSSLLSALLFGSQQITSVLALSSSISADAPAYKPALATLPSASSISVDALVYKPAIATLPAVATLSATASIALRGTATLPLSSDISANSQIAFVGRATLPLSGSFFAATLWYPIAIATLPASSSLAVEAKAYKVALATLPLNSTFLANTIGTQQVTALLAATASFYSDSIQRGQIAASAVITPTASLSCFAAQRWVTNTSLLAATASLLANSIQLFAAVAKIDNSSSLSCFANKLVAARATLPIISSLIADSQIVVPIQASATLPANSTIEARGAIPWSALALLNGTSTLSADLFAQSASNVFPVLNCSSTLTVDATRIAMIRHWQRHITGTGKVGLKNKLKGDITRPNLTGEVS